MSDLFSLAGHVALVTGASRGLGLAMAKAMGQFGATVVINGRDGSRLEAAAASLREAGVGVETAVFDVCDYAAGARAVADIAARHGRLDIAVLNAGVQHRVPLPQWTVADFQRVIETNLTACFALAHAAAGAMVPRRHGRIIFTASIMGIVGRATIPAYTAAKAGLMGLTKSLAVELGPQGITVNSICPGFFATEMNAGIVADPELAQRLTARIPLGRWAEPDEIGGAAVFLASRAGSFVNGHALVVDGGHTVSA